MHRVADVVVQAGLATMAPGAPWDWQADGAMLVEGDLLRRVGQKRN
jgi:hypothetical protein